MERLLSRNITPGTSFSIPPKSERSEVSRKVTTNGDTQILYFLDMSGVDWTFGSVVILANVLLCSVNGESGQVTFSISVSKGTAGVISLSPATVWTTYSGLSGFPFVIPTVTFDVNGSVAITADGTADAVEAQWYMELEIIQNKYEATT